MTHVTMVMIVEACAEALESASLASVCVMGVGWASTVVWTVTDKVPVPGPSTPPTVSVSSVTEETSVPFLVALDSMRTVVAMVCVMLQPDTASVTQDGQVG